MKDICGSYGLDIRPLSVARMESTLSAELHITCSVQSCFDDTEEINTQMCTFAINYVIVNLDRQLYVAQKAHFAYKTNYCKHQGPRVIRPLSVRSSKFSTCMLTNEKQRKTRPIRIREN